MARRLATLRAHRAHSAGDQSADEAHHARRPSLPRATRLTRPFILTVGVLEPRKNQTMLLEVLRELRKQGQRSRADHHRAPGMAMGRSAVHRQVSRHEAVGQDSRGYLRSRLDRILQSRGDLHVSVVLRRLRPADPRGDGMWRAGDLIRRFFDAGGRRIGRAVGRSQRRAEHSPRKRCGCCAIGNLRDAMVDAGIERARMFTWRSTAEATLASLRGGRAVRSQKLKGVTEP